jgi:hypothetical protein
MKKARISNNGGLEVWVLFGIFIFVNEKFGRLKFAPLFSKIMAPVKEAIPYVVDSIIAIVALTVIIVVTKTVLRLRKRKNEKGTVILTKQFHELSHKRKDLLKAAVRQSFALKVAKQISENGTLDVQTTNGLFSELDVVLSGKEVSGKINEIATQLTWSDRASSFEQELLTDIICAVSSHEIEQKSFEIQRQLRQAYISYKPKKRKIYSKAQ